MKNNILAAFAALILACQFAHAQKESVLYTFKSLEDGDIPESGLIRDAAGNLYGCTLIGGTYDQGTVYKLSRQGKTILYNFRGKEDGGYPGSPLILDNAGNLYGVTAVGGDMNCITQQGCGTVFKINLSGKEEVLHQFTETASDGGIPQGGLVRDGQGNFYGPTAAGGIDGWGTVFKLEPGGKETILHSFTGCLGGPDGCGPVGSLVLDPEGNLYGATVGGGRPNAGVVYKLTQDGTETILHTFTGGADGDNPMAGLIWDSQGNLYGTTNTGGISSAGTIFKVEPSGKETVLYTFSRPGDGNFPQGPLLPGADGNLYGNTVMGGTYRLGTVFRYNLSTGKETILHNFGAMGDGQYPVGQMASDSQGNIYGNADGGGTFSLGAVFEVIP